jgi:hypothetical protein
MLDSFARQKFKRFRVISALSGEDRLQVSDAVFKPLIESPQKNTGEKPNRVCRSQIEWALTDSVDCFCQKFAHFSHVFQGSMREVAGGCVPAAILNSAPPSQFCQFLGMSMAKTQAALYRRSLAGIACLRCSFAMLSLPAFQGFLRLKAHGSSPGILNY